MESRTNPEARSSQPKRKASGTPRRPVSQSTNLQQPQQYDASKYRILIYCFSSNLSQYYGKKHKDILGELQQLYKISLTREERLIMEDGMDNIVDKYAGKLMRDIMLRNGAIAKSIAEYSETYNRSQKLSTDPMADNIKTIDFTDTQIVETQPKLSLDKKTNRQRPYSSTRTTSKQIMEGLSGMTNKGNIFKNRASRHDIHKIMEYGVPTENQESTCFVFIRENCRKVNKAKFHGRYHKHSDGLAFMSEYEAELKSCYFRMTDENQMNNNEANQQFYQSQKLVGSKSKDLSNRVTKIVTRQENGEEKYMARTNLNKFFNIQIQSQNWSTKQKSIDQLDRQKIQNRILSMNGALSANVVKTQGYKPKSKCWGTAVSLAGKIVGQHHENKAFSMIKYK